MFGNTVTPELGSGGEPVFKRSLVSGLRLGALPGAVSCGRLHVRQVLWEWRSPVNWEDAELIASELLTNAVKASTVDEGYVPAIWIRLYSDDKQVLIEVGDRSDEVPAMVDLNEHVLGGRGLVLVHEISERWGYYFLGYKRKVVWAIL